MTQSHTPPEFDGHGPEIDRRAREFLDWLRTVAPAHTIADGSESFLAYVAMISIVLQSKGGTVDRVAALAHTLAILSLDEADIIARLRLVGTCAQAAMTLGPMLDPLAAPAQGTA